LKLAFCWAHGRRKLLKATPKAGSPIVDEALIRIAALYKIEDSIRGSDPEDRRDVRQTLSPPLVDEFFTWIAAQAARVSRKSDLGIALAYMLKRQDGFRLFLDDGHVDIDSNLVENAIRRPAMNRRNAFLAGHDEGGRNWARFASLIGSCKMNGVEPYAYLLVISSHISPMATLPEISTISCRGPMPLASRPHNELVGYYPVNSHPYLTQDYQAAATEKPMGRGRRLPYLRYANGDLDTAHPDILSGAATRADHELRMVFWQKRLRRGN